MSLYLDASVLVALFVVDPSSARAEAFLSAHPEIVVVSDFAVAEFASATLEIARHGYRVIRFWNNDVMDNLAGVLEVIRRELECPLCPSGGEGGDPSPRRRGG